jgi:hypothetical protein
MNCRLDEALSPSGPGSRPSPFLVLVYISQEFLPRAHFIIKNQEVFEMNINSYLAKLSWLLFVSFLLFGCAPDMAQVEKQMQVYSQLRKTPTTELISQWKVLNSQYQAELSNMGSQTLGMMASGRPSTWGFYANPGYDAAATQLNIIEAELCRRDLKGIDSWDAAIIRSRCDDRKTGR